MNEVIEREVIKISDLQDQYGHLYKCEDEYCDSMLYYFAHEGGIYDEDKAVYIFEEVDSIVDSYDLDHSCKEVTKIYERKSDGKLFKWSYTDSYYVSVDEEGWHNPEMTETLAKTITQTITTTVYE